MSFPPTSAEIEHGLDHVEVQEVKILSDHVSVSIGSGMEKILSIPDFISILSRSLGESLDKKLNGFSLPSNVFYFASSATMLQISCYYQARVSEILYFEDKMSIVMPNVIISHVLEKTSESEWKVSTSKYFCTDLPVSRLPREFINSVQRSKHILLLPMSNTYESAQMCYGNNSMPSRMSEGNLRGLDWYYQYMFESPFNDDLGIIAIGHKLNPANWYKKLRTLAKEGEPFPYEDLNGFVPL